jgi:hypothetical protein
VVGERDGTAECYNNHREWILFLRRRWLWRLGQAVKIAEITFLL